MNKFLPNVSRFSTQLFSPRIGKWGVLGVLIGALGLGAAPAVRAQESVATVPQQVVQEAEGAQELAGEKTPGAEEANASPDQVGSNQAGEVAVRPVDPERFLTLGSLNDEGRHRYLLTFSERGAALIRVELNARNSNGRYTYRDKEHFGAYLGRLQLDSQPEGLLVGIVGKDTPADRAGIQQGDRLVKWGDEVLTQEAQFVSLLEKTKPKEEVALTVLPAGASEPVVRTVTLTERPLELINHEVNVVEPGLVSQPSFLLSLLKPENPEWKEIDLGMRTARWESVREDVDGREAITFRYEISAESMAAVGMVGPVVVKKRFSIPRLEPAQAQDQSGRTFDIRLELIIENAANTPQVFGVRLDGPTGATTEGWWYQTKSHGNSSAVFKTAGARDVVTSTYGTPYYFWGAPEIVSKSASPNPQFIIREPQDQTSRANELNFLGVDTQYFNISLLPTRDPENSEENFQVYSALSFVAANRVPKEAARTRLADCSFIVFDRVEVPAASADGSGVYRQKFDVFAGPKQKSLLQTYGLEDNLNFGWFAFFSKLLVWLLRVFYQLTMGASYGIAIIMLTVMVRLLMLPISRKASQNAQMMQLLAPEIKRINQKYEGDLAKQRQAQAELYRRYKFNPAGGCLLGLIQLPIFLGLYKGLSIDIALRDQPLIPGMQWCSNLAAPDQLFYWKDYLPTWLGSETGYLGPYFNVLPLLTIALFLIQQKLFTPPPTDEQQAMAQRIMSFMMIFMCVMFFKVPAGLCIYFVTSSLWAIVERVMLPKAQLPEAQVNAIRNSLAEGDAGVVSGRVVSSSSTSSPQNNSGEQSLMGRFRSALEQSQKKKSEVVDPESLKQQDKERRRKLRDRGNS